MAEHAKCPGGSDVRGSAVTLDAVRATLAARAAAFVGTIEFLDGLAELTDGASGRRRPLECGMRVSSDMVLEVASGRALLRLDDGSDVWLAAGSRLDLSSWSAKARRLLLASGRALALVASEARRTFTISAPAGVVTVTGTAFEVDARGDALAVAVLHGSVEVDAGGAKAHVLPGRTARTARGAAPRVERTAAHQVDWPGSIAASAGNRRISAAYRAAARSLRAPSTNESKGNGSMSTGTKAMGVVAALAAIAVGGYLAFGSHRPASRPASAPATTAPATPKAGGAPASAWTEKSEAKRMIRLRGADGKDIVLEGTPEEMKAQISKLPAELQDKVRGIIEKMPAGGQGGPGAAMGLPERATQQLQADAMAAAGVYRQLLESGKSPEEAKAIVEASLTDSLRKQITDLTGGKGNTNIKVAINGVPGGNDGKTTLAVMLSEEQTAGDAPPPPQASPTPSQGS